ncbi:hypothetical protein EVG20_g10367 [Dentipellis fragilis]|uniref:Uncharacterized protein n=1 Tax=Dentipellis fragilis TaxID=205917 RepID=A0A4Y9XUP3_9AGAM|nr:hypothetical protein EVG20_g10367 [Dentipellis fragilis]
MSDFVTMDEFDQLRQAWHRSLLETLFGAVMYGIGLILSSATIITLVRADAAECKLASKQLLIVLVLMLILATMYLIVGIVSTFKFEYVPEVIEDVSLVLAHVKIPVWAEHVQNALFTLQVILGDLVNVRSSLYIALLFILTQYRIDLALLHALREEDYHGCVSRNDCCVGILTGTGVFAPAFLENSIWAALTLMSMLYCTFMIAWKIYATICFTQRTENLSPVLVIVIETNMLYTAFILVYLITTCASISGQGILDALVAQLPPIVLCIFVLQIMYFQDSKTVYYSDSETTSAGGMWAALRRLFRFRREISDADSVSTFLATPVT